MDETTLRDLVLEPERFEQDERTPFASIPWAASSHVVWREGDGTGPLVVDGKTFEYFLEPSIIKEFKEGLEIAEPEALVDRVIQYARDDA